MKSKTGNRLRIGSLREDFVDKTEDDDSDLDKTSQISSEKLPVYQPQPRKLIEPKPFEIKPDQNDCILHPAPAQVFLPSGYLKDKMEDSNESPA